MDKDDGRALVVGIAISLVDRVIHIADCHDLFAGKVRIAHLASIAWRHTMIKANDHMLATLEFLAGARHSFAHEREQHNRI